MAQRSTLTRDDWAHAALDALVAGGLRAVAVEPIAKTLGATKGSFYWHFKDRRALLEAALELWAAQTEAIGEEARAAPGGPRGQLRRLFELAYDGSNTGADGALLSETHDPTVAAVVARVTARRLEILEALNREAGVADPAAQARYDYTAFLGLVALHRVAPDAVGDLEAYVAGLAARLDPPAENLST